MKNQSKFHRMSWKNKIFVGLLAVSLLSVILLFRETTSRAALKTEESGSQPELVIQTGSTSLVNTVAISKDGKMLASGGGDGVVRLWDAATGRQIKSLFGHTHYIMTVAFSSDDQWLASGGFDNTIRLWDVRTGKQIKVLEGHTGFVFSAAFSPAGEWLASGSADNTVKLWNLKTGAQKTLEGHSDYVFSVAFSPDGSRLATGSTDKTIKIWDMNGGNLLKSFDGNAEEIWTVAFSPDGKTLVSGSKDGTIKLWDLEKGETKSWNNGSREVYSAVFSPNGKTLASGGKDGKIKIWEAESGQPVKTLAGHQNYVKALVFSPGAETLVSGGSDRTIRLWNLGSGEQTGLIEGHTDPVTTAVFSRDGTMLAGAGIDNKISLWDLKTGEQIKSFKYDIPIVNLITAIAFSPDGKILASGNNFENSLVFWDVQTGKQAQTLRGHNSRINSIAFSPGGNILASGSEDNKIILWDAATGALVKTLEGHGKGVTSVAFSPDGAILFSGSKDGTVKLWNVDKGQLINSLTGHTDEVSSIAVSSDGELLASSSFDKTVRLWKTRSGEPVKVLGDSSDKLTSVSFSTDGKTLASGRRDGDVMVWNLADGNYRLLEGNKKEISSINFAPNKNLFVSSSWDATIKLWRTDDDKPIATLISLDQNDWVVNTPEGRFHASPGAQKLMYYVYGQEFIELEQLKTMYYEPGLLPKFLGFSKDSLRSIVPLKDIKLFPEILDKSIPENSTKLTFRIRNRGGGIGQVQIFISNEFGNKLAVEDARDEKLKANPDMPEAILTVDLKGTNYLKGRENRVSIVTSNYLKEINMGNIQSRGAEIVWRPPGQEDIQLPTLYAIVGGVSDYTDQELDLRFAAKDAEDFSMALSLGAKKLFCKKEIPNCLDKVKITTLSTSGNDGTIPPTKTNFIKAFREVAANARPEDILVVYLAGHGISFAGKTDNYFYLTQEANTSDRIKLSQALTTSTISSEELNDWLRPNTNNPDDIFIKAMKQVMILDTCAAGNAAERLAVVKPRDLTVDQQRAIEFLKDKTGTWILMANTADAPSYEASQYGQGLLTYSLLQAIKGAALDKGEFVDVQQLFSYAQREVPRLAANINGVQRPVFSVPLGSSFPIGHMTDTEKEQIKLPLPKPILLRPLLSNPENGDDDLKLIPALRKEFDAESSFYIVSQRKGINSEPAWVYIDDESFPSALRVTGVYSYENGQIHLKAFLRKDGKTIFTFPEIIGDKDKVIAELLSTVRDEVNKIAKKTSS